MDEQTFLQRMSELTETDVSELSLSMELTQLNIWDSMAAAAFVAFAAEHGATDIITGLLQAKTLGDLFVLTQGVADAYDR